MKVSRKQFFHVLSQNETELLLQKAEHLGFPGMLGFTNSYKSSKRNCPTGRRRQYDGKEGVATISLEVIFDNGLYFWNVFFRQQNAITILQSSMHSPSQRR